MSVDIDTTPAVKKTSQIDLTGQVFGTLTVLSWAGRRRYRETNKTMWLVRCTCGTEKVVVGNNLRNGATTSCGDQIAHRHAAVGKGAGYVARHKRVYDLRGPASDQICVDCEQQAHDWSHIHGMNPNVPESYEPRCRPCHVWYDKYPGAPAELDEEIVEALQDVMGAWLDRLEAFKKRDIVAEFRSLV